MQNSKPGIYLGPKGPLRENLAMESLKQILEKILVEAFHSAFPGCADSCTINVTVATQEKFGHYQCNSAMKLAKSLGRSPKDIASALVKKIPTHVFESIEIAGPGFINLTLDRKFLSKKLNEIVPDPRLGIPLPQKREKIIVEFSSPNIAKEMHVGHLRSTIIGDAIARLYEFLGHEVIRLNHLGDWGTAFGMLIAYLKEEVPDVLLGKKSTDLSSLMAWYRASKRRFDEDENFKLRARQSVVALQSGDQEALAAWRMICDISRKAFQEVYDILDVKIQERGESFYNPMLQDVVAELEKKGLVTLSEGAKCVFHEGYQIPLMIQKSDGGYNYDTTDIAAMRHRILEEHADKIVIVTDAGQSLHFALVEETAIKAGYLKPASVHFRHVPFGVVLGEDGKKFRTRSGETERLIDLLTTAIAQAKKILKEREPERDLEEIETIAPILGIDAVKYADLSCNRIGDYLFSYERMLRFEGNTAAFILYSYARVNGIKRKVGNIDMDRLIQEEQILLEHPSEIGLGLHLLRFYDTLKNMEEELLPNYLTDYLYILAQKFNIFFRDCKVAGALEQNPRLLLCEMTARTMSQGLTILGIRVVDRM